MIIQIKFTKMKNKILSTCLQGSYRNSLGEFSNTSNDVLGAERVIVKRDNSILVTTCLITKPSKHLAWANC